MAGRKQIVFCTDGIFPHAVGGMQRHSALLIEELAKMNVVDLVVIHPHDKKVFNNPAITEIALNHQGGKKNYLVECYNYSKKVMDALSNFPDAIIYSQGLSVWYKCSSVKKRLIVNPHGLEPYQTIDYINYFKTAPLRFAFGIIYKNAARVVSLGGRLTGILERVAGKDKIAVIPNAVNVGAMPVRNWDKDQFHLLFVGRFAENKGIHVLMNAVDSLNKGGYSQRYHYHLVGKGPLFEEYKSKYNFSNVTFHGFASDEELTSMYGTYDAFVFPTLYEGMPTVVLEAMAKGMPVIVSDTGATAEQVDHTNGYLIEKNNLRALKWALQEFYQSSAEQKAKLSLNSYERVKNHFTWDVVAKMHVELFNTFPAGS